MQNKFKYVCIRRKYLFEQKIVVYDENFDNLFFIMIRITK